MAPTISTTTFFFQDFSVLNCCRHFHNTVRCQNWVRLSWDGCEWCFQKIRTSTFLILKKIIMYLNFRCYKSEWSQKFIYFCNIGNLIGSRIFLVKKVDVPIVSRKSQKIVQFKTMVGISVSLGDFQLACANCYSLENTKLIRNLFVGVKRNESATSALDTNWLVYFLGKLMYM